jgi:hypothetical protein
MADLRWLQIDLNRRTADGLSPVPYDGPVPRVGEPVIVFEPEDGVRIAGRIARVDTDRGVAYVAVDWNNAQSDSGPTSDRR